MIHNLRNLGVLLAVAIAAGAVPVAAAPPVVDPSVPVPPVVYRSVFTDVPRGVETGSIDWSRANADVGQFRRGHVDVLKWEESEDARRGAPTSPPAGHGGHGDHRVKP